MKDIDIDSIDNYTLEELQEYLRQSQQKPIKKIKVKASYVFFGVILNPVIAIIPAIVMIVEWNLSWWLGFPLYFVVWGAVGCIEILIATIMNLANRYIEIEEEK